MSRVVVVVGLTLTAVALAPRAHGQEPPAPAPDPRPCESAPAYRQFDFWLGDWDVATPQGDPAGRNTIRAIAGGCALIESYTSARGPFVGESLNYYDPQRERWIQVWVDSSGTRIRIEGGLEAGSMRLTGELAGRDGRRDAFRGTWTPLPDGRVRQLFEQSKDGGATWQVWFDGYYSRR